MDALERNIRIVKQVRYNAAARFESTHHWILFCLNCTAFGAVLFTLIPGFKIKIFEPDIASFWSVSYSVMAMVLAILIGGIDHKSFAEQLKRSADQLVGLQQEIEAAKHENKFAAKYVEISAKYAKVMQTSPKNHPDVDYKKLRLNEQKREVAKLKLQISTLKNRLKLESDETEAKRLRLEVLNIKSARADVRPKLREVFINFVLIYSFRFTMFALAVSPFILIACHNSVRLLFTLLRYQKIY